MVWHPAAGEALRRYRHDGRPELVDGVLKFLPLHLGDLKNDFCKLYDLCLLGHSSGIFLVEQLEENAVGIIEI